MGGKIAASGQLGVWERSCPAAGHCCIGASPGEVGLKVEAAEPGFAIVAVGLEKGLHLLEVSEPQEPQVGLEAMGVGVEKIFGHSEQGENRCLS